MLNLNKLIFLLGLFSLYSFSQAAYQLSNITLKSPINITLNKKQHLQKLLTQTRLNNILQTVQKQLLSQGYIFSQLQVFLDTISPFAINLNIIVNPQAGYKFGALKPHTSYSSLLQKYSLLKIGKNFNPFKLTQAIQRINQSPYFSWANPPQIARDSLRHIIYPVWHLKLIPNNLVEFNLRYHTDNKSGLQGLIKLQLLNVLNTFRDLHFSLFKQKTQTEFTLFYKEPWVFTTPFTVDFYIRLFQEINNYQTLQLKIKGIQENFSFNYGILFEYNTNQQFTLQNSNIQSQSSLTGLYSRFFNFQKSKQKSYDITTELSVGQQNQNNVQTVITSYYLDIQYWIPLHLFSLYHRWSSKGKFPANHFNTTDLFQLGGASNIRGYQSFEILAHWYWYNNLEFQWNFYNTNKLFVFWDPAITKQPTTTKTSFYQGYGIGFILQPNNTRFAINYSLNPTRPLHEGVINIIVENRF